MKKSKTKSEQPKVYFTSDLHLNHANILKYCNRPFKDVHEMDHVIFQNFRDILRRNDILYILGDLTFKPRYAESFLKMLTNKGVEVHFIVGNHDKDGGTLGIIAKYCKSVKDLSDINIHGTHITLCHYPMSSWNGSFHGAWHLYGHVHGRRQYKTKQYDVGVDSNDFKPISFTQLHRIMKYKLADRRDNKKR